MVYSIVSHRLIAIFVYGTIHCTTYPFFALPVSFIFDKCFSNSLEFKWTGKFNPQKHKYTSSKKENQWTETRQTWKIENRNTEQTSEQNLIWIKHFLFLLFYQHMNMLTECFIWAHFPPCLVYFVEMIREKNDIASDGEREVEGSKIMLLY